VTARCANVQTAGKRWATACVLKITMMKEDRTMGKRKKSKKRGITMHTSTTNIGRHSKSWETWRNAIKDHEYYDDAEFINETQKGRNGVDDDHIPVSDCDLAGIPTELWPEIDRKGKGNKVDHSSSLLNSRTPDLKTSGSFWPDTKDAKYVHTPAYVVPECHKGNVLLFTHDNISLYGGGSTRGMKIWEDAFIIDMGDVVDEKYVEFAGCNYPELYTIKLIKVACKDFSVPSIGTTFWGRLAAILRREAAASHHDPIKVVCCCVGGHGRTGIALSILSALLGVVPSDDCPVEWVRNHYCKYAVESTKQLKYIEEVTERKVKSKEPESRYTTSLSRGGESTYPYSYGY
jgi:hypothetical protein